MTLYQKFLNLTGLVHITEAEFNAALKPKTDAQKALHDFIKWSVGKTDANPEAASFRKAIDTTLTDTDGDSLVTPTVPVLGDVTGETVTVAAVASEEHKADVHDTVVTSLTAPEPEDHKADVHDSVLSSPVVPEPEDHKATETVSESVVGEPSTLVVK